MLSVLGASSRMCDGTTRREVLRVGALSTLGLSLDRLVASEDRQPRSEGPAKAVILVNLIGDPAISICLI